MIVYITADDLDYFAYADINEMEDAISRFNIGANIAIYWDQSAAGKSNPYSTGTEIASVDNWKGIYRAIQISQGRTDFLDFTR